METIKNRIKYLSYLIALLLSSFIYGQGTTCTDADPFCAGGSSLVFENTSNGSTAEVGPDYGCLGSEPNPAWYFLQINQAGNIIINIAQNTQQDFTGTGLDVDFICYGPFATEASCGAQNLTAANTVACSYSAAAVENFTINNAQVGEIYILLITNFAGAPGYIQVEQTNSGAGAGGTDCSIVNTSLEHCEGEIIFLDATNGGAVTYEWYRDAVLLAEMGPILNNVTAPSATYTIDKFNAAGNLIETEVFVVNFSSVPIANPVTDYILCDDATADGMTLFNLSTKDAEVIGVQTQVTITYHLDPMDAINDTNPLAINYTNVGNPEIIYVRIENDNNPDCFDTTSFSLQVDAQPTAATAPDLVVCDDLSNDGVDIFDLTSQEATIIGAQVPADITVSYHQTPADANNDINPILIPGAFANIGSPDQIYVRVENNLNTTCFAVSTFNLVVNPVPPVIVPIPLRICDDDMADGFTVFDLTVRDAEITGGNTNYTVVYYETLVDAQNDTNPIVDPTMYTNTSNPQTLYVRVTDTSTSSNCFITTTLEIEVLLNPTPETNINPIVLCDDFGGNDGQEVFDLTVNEVQIFNGQLYTASYHNSETDADQDIGAIATPTAYTNINNPETIYVRVENADGCHEVVNFELIVNPLPDAIGVPNLIECELNSDGLYDFDLDSKTNEILNGQSPAIFMVTYHETQGEADNNMNPLVSPYTNVLGNPQEIFVSITNTTTGCSISTISFFIEVRNQPTATAPANDYIVCDNFGDNDGIAEFDLSTQDAEILNGQLPADYTVTYYADQMDAIDFVNPLPNIYVNISNPQVIYARVDNNLGFCFELTQVTLRVQLIPEFSLDESYILCIDTDGNLIITADSPPTIDTGLSDADHDFEWSFEGTVIAGETTSTLVANQTGNYSVTVSDSTSGLGCMSTASTTVNPSSPPDVVAVVISNAFDGNNVIEATATGTGEYEFSLDGGPWLLGTDQGNGSYIYLFNNVTAGEHTIRARDVNGCGEDSDMVIIMDYPLFFTPNGDGYNDTWNIVNIQTQPNAKIFIYDRYGKLLKQLSPTGIGWNGTFNGEPLPTTDYWFTVNYMEPRDGVAKQFKAHFSLKR